MQTPPDVRGAQLLPVGVLGLGDPPRQLTSDTTHLDGIIAGIDVLPTVARLARRRRPRHGQGAADRAVSGRDAAALESRADRLRVVLPRRLPALWTLVGGWLVVLLTSVLVADRRGLRWSLRIGALAVLWVPAVRPADRRARALAHRRAAARRGAVAVARRAHRPRWCAWPRGPALPAGVGLVAYVVDLAAGSPLIIRSLLGPNPLFGSRFYGIGNELEAALCALMVIGLAALLLRARTLTRRRARRSPAPAWRSRSRSEPGGWAPTSAASSPSAAGAATAALMMLPGGLSRRARPDRAGRAGARARPARGDRRADRRRRALHAHGAARGQRR